MENVETDRNIQLRIENTVHEKISPQFEKLESKLQRLHVIIYTFLSVAAVFGLIGSWGYNILYSAYSRLTALETQIAALETQTNKVITTKEEYEESFKAFLSDESNIARESYQNNLNDNIQNTIENLSFENLKVKSLNVVGNNDETIAVISENSNGSGSLWLYNPQGTELVLIGGSTNGDGGLWLSNSEGIKGLNAIAAESAGNVEIYSAKTEQRIAEIGESSTGNGDLRLYNPQGTKLVSIGGSTNGDGGLWLSNSEGIEGLSAVAAESAGNVEIYSAKTEQRIAKIGESSSGNGDLRLYNPQGTELVSIGGSTNGDGGLWLSNSEGIEGLSAVAAESAGNVEIYSAKTEQRIAEIGGDSSGNGDLRLHNPQGTELVALGGSTNGDGGLWLFNSEGIEVRVID